jgi:hypothetical protein
MKRFIQISTFKKEGAYIGCGQDSFAGSWIVFDPAQGNGKVALAVESK